MLEDSIADRTPEKADREIAEIPIEEIEDVKREDRGNREVGTLIETLSVSIYQSFYILLLTGYSRKIDG